jgi:hypothetical protein
MMPNLPCEQVDLNRDIADLLQRNNQLVPPAIPTAIPTASITHFIDYNHLPSDFSLARYASTAPSCQLNFIIDYQIAPPGQQIQIGKTTPHQSCCLSILRAEF